MKSIGGFVIIRRNKPTRHFASIVLKPSHSGDTENKFGEHTFLIFRQALRPFSKLSPSITTRLFTTFQMHLTEYDLNIDLT